MLSPWSPWSDGVIVELPRADAGVVVITPVGALGRPPWTTSEGRYPKATTSRVYI